MKYKLAYIQLKLVVIMGRKKKKPVKPWCWYCNREFDDEKILIQHQRAKHYKCPFCHKKLYSGPGLTVHCVQVHKEQLDKIPEALPNRNSVDIDIYGMQGIPHDDVVEHERSKRGEEAPLKNNKEKTVNVPTNQHNNKQQPKQAAAYGHTSVQSSMEATMFQHALGVGPMPPGFPYGAIPPPNFMGHPPPGFPPMMGPPPMIQAPGAMSFPPGQMPTMLPHMLPPHQMDPSQPPPLLGPMASTSSMIPPPPPMSGVGPLIGIPPPPFVASNGATRIGNQYDDDDVPSPPPSPPSPPAPPSNSASRKPSEEDSSNRNSNNNNFNNNPTWTSGSVRKSQESLGFIEISGTNSRIMHPHKDLSMEELRMTWKRYHSVG